MADPRARTATIEALGRSDAFLLFSEQLAAAAKVDRPVLLVGERGTGKELAAIRLHYHSQRWRGPLVTLNCAALPPSLQEAELFGHEAGAYTGAVSRRSGRFELADSGTLFLDEIGTMDLPLQEKILRAVEYGVFERLGGTSSVEVDVRIIGATNADLPDLVKKGRFKHDLLDRLSFEVLTLPPLRERGQDILLLAEHFAARMAVELRLPEVPEFEDHVVDQLMAHPWPGNVRELKNVVERAVYRAGSARVEELVFDPFASPHGPSQGSPHGQPQRSSHETVAAPDQGVAAAEPQARTDSSAPSPRESLLAMDLPKAVQELELMHLRQALARARHNQKRAARLMGLTYHQFRGLYRKYGNQMRDGDQAD